MSRRDLPEGEVHTIRQRRGDSLANGGLWGVGVGAGFGLVGGVLAAGDEYSDVSGWFIPVAAALYGR